MNNISADIECVVSDMFYDLYRETGYLINLHNEYLREIWRGMYVYKIIDITTRVGLDGRVTMRLAMTGERE